MNEFPPLRPRRMIGVADERGQVMISREFTQWLEAIASRSFDGGANSDGNSTLFAAYPVDSGASGAGAFATYPDTDTPPLFASYGACDAALPFGAY